MWTRQHLEEDHKKTASVHSLENCEESDLILMTNWNYLPFKNFITEQILGNRFYRWAESGTQINPPSPQGATFPFPTNTCLVSIGFWASSCRIWTQRLQRVQKVDNLCTKCVFSDVSFPYQRCISRIIDDVHIAGGTFKLGKISILYPKSCVAYMPFSSEPWLVFL